jgi:SAM-dependent methyltransferase
MIVSAENDTRCPECASVDNVPYFVNGEIDFLRCARCSLVWRNPIPDIPELVAIYKDAYAEENVFSGSTNQESGVYATEQYARYLVKHVLLNGDSILDYGAATGELVAKLRQLGFATDGYEFSDDARDYCRRNRNIELFDSPADIPKKRYRVITMIEVIEHLREPGSTLRELAACLEAGGQVFITTPNRNGWRARVEGGTWREACKKFHLYLFDETSIINLLRESGFSNIRRLRFTPITRPGLVYWLWGRLMQIIGLGGTLSILAERNNGEIV